MACERYVGALAEVAAGAPASAGLESHLASCTRCREELAALRQALALADREMAGVLSVEPSPGLAARIRRAVAERPPTPLWTFAWTWPVAAAAAALLAALGLWVGRAPSPSPEARVAVAGPVVSRQDPRGERVAASGDLLAPFPGTPGGEPVTSRVLPPPRPAGLEGTSARRPVTPGARGTTAPEVLVPPGEAEALLRFAAHLQQRTLEPGSLLVADLSAPLPEPRGLEIAPIEIVPLDPAETSGTD